MYKRSFISSFCVETKDNLISISVFLCVFMKYPRVVLYTEVSIQKSRHVLFPKVFFSPQVIFRNILWHSDSSANP